MLEADDAFAMSNDASDSSLILCDDGHRTEETKMMLADDKPLDSCDQHDEQHDERQPYCKRAVEQLA